MAFGVYNDFTPYCNPCFVLVRFSNKWLRGIAAPGIDVFFGVGSYSMSEKLDIFIVENWDYHFADMAHVTFLPEAISYRKSTKPDHLPFDFCTKQFLLIRFNKMFEYILQRMFVQFSVWP